MKRVLTYFLWSITCLLGIATILGHTDFGNSYKSDLPDSQYLVWEQNQIRYVQKGNGKDLLLIHGTPGSIEDWQPIVTALSDTYRVTAIDRLGHGYSTDKDYNYDLQSNAAMVAGVIDRLSLRDPLIIGHSYGGSTVAQMITHHYNDSLQYIIIDSPLYEVEPDPIYRLITIPVIGKGIGLIASYTIAPGLIEDGVRGSFKNQSESQILNHIERRKKIWIQPKVVRARATEVINYQDDLDQIIPKYANIEAKVMLITGNDRDHTFRSDAEKFSKEVLTDTLIILDNTGHYIQFDQQNKIVDLIHKWVNRSIH